MAAGPIREADGALWLEVKVVPRASRDRLGPLLGDRLKVQLAAPPVDGEANEALRALLARALGVPRSAVEIVRGQTARAKTVRIEGGRRADLERLLDPGRPRP